MFPYVLNNVLLHFFFLTKELNYFYMVIEENSFDFKNDSVRQIGSLLSIFVFYYWATALHGRLGILPKEHLKFDLCSW